MYRLQQRPLLGNGTHRMTPDQIIEAIRQLNDWDLKAVIEEATSEMSKRRDYEFWVREDCRE
jgi:hypothetical protein